MDIYAAIDLRGGKCVRLAQGDFDRETAYSDDPVGVAQGFAEAGAPWLHVVDLDGALRGERMNRDAVAAISAAVDIPVQVAGGIRDEKTARGLLDGGVRRIVLGTAALESPEILATLSRLYPGRVAVGLDGRDGRLATWGWTRVAEISVLDALHLLSGAGVAAIVFTEVAHDGTLQGPDLGAISEMLEATHLPFIAAGGVGTLEDLRALAAIEVGRDDVKRVPPRRLSGVIIGKALYEEAFTIAEALEATAAPPHKQG